MKCDKCKKNEANFHKVSNINGKVSEIHLCSECAKQNGDFDFFKEFNNSRNFLNDFISDFKTSFSYFTNPEIDNFLDFNNDIDNFIDNRFFANDLLENKNFDRKIKKYNENTNNNSLENDKIKLEIQKLDIALKKAVVEERYEDAVTLRDKIKSLKEKLKH